MEYIADIEANRPDELAARVRGNWQHQCENADRRNQHHPPHEHQHRVAQTAKERHERRARGWGDPGDRQGEDQREENERYHRPTGGGGDRVGRDQRRQPAAERLARIGGQLAGGRGRPRGKRRTHPAGEQRKQQGRQRNSHGRRGDEQQHEHEQRPSPQSPDRRQIADRRDTRDQQRHDQRDHRHPDGVYPESTNGRSHHRPPEGANRFPAPQMAMPSAETQRPEQMDRRACFLSSDPMRGLGHIIRSPPLISSSRPSR